MSRGLFTLAPRAFDFPVHSRFRLPAQQPWHPFRISASHSDKGAEVLLLLRCWLQRSISVASGPAPDSIILHLLQAAAPRRSSTSSLISLRRERRSTICT